VLPEFGVRGELRVASAEIGVDGIDAQPLCPGAELNFSHALAT